MRRGFWVLLCIVLSVAPITPTWASDPSCYGSPGRQKTPTGAVAHRNDLLTSLRLDRVGEVGPWQARIHELTGLPARISGRSTILLGKSPQETVSMFLRVNGNLLGLAQQAQDLRTVRVQESLGGHHVRMQQLAGKIPVWRAEVSVHMDKTYHIDAVNSRYIPGVAAPQARSGISADEAVRAARTAARVDGKLRAAPLTETVVYPNGGTSVLAWRVVLPAKDPVGDFEVIVDASTGKALRLEDLLKHATAPGLVFDPNPVVALKNNKLRDNDNADGPDFSGAYKEVTLLGLDDPTQLKGQYVRVSDYRADSGGFNFNRGQQGFEQVMAYYHLDRVQRYFQSLGYQNLNNRVQEVAAHGTSDDNSWFSPATKQITYGDGGVDDAEDADVICHEYGHSCMDNVIPGYSGSDEAGAMGEGFGDYLASTMRSDLTFQKDVVASWDATSYSQDDPPALRRMDSKKMYPQDMEGEVHADGEIWSAVLWQIWNKVGKDVADKVVFESLYSMSPSPTFADGAQAMLEADNKLFGGSHAEAIKAIFVARGILKN